MLGLATVRRRSENVRTATATLTGVATSYLVSYAIPGGWLATDYVQVVAYPLFGAVQYAEELFAGRLGAAIRPDDRVTAAIVLDQIKLWIFRSSGILGASMEPTPKPRMP